MLEALSSTCSATEKERVYQLVLQRIRLLVAGETDLVAVLSTIACELHHTFGYFSWTGFYQVAAAEERALVIGPYQGTHGCLRITVGKGVCGTAAQQRLTQLVPNVHEFPGHIACASTTQSEIVVPYFADDGTLLGVLDVDSDEPAAFDEVDQRYLEEVCNLMRGWDRLRQPVSRFS